MQLSRRLQAVADMVTPGSRVADIGCDHAYIPIYLAENDISPHIIAMDINQGPIDRAEENIVRYGFTDRIETRRSDGLKELKPGEVNCLILAGMGGPLTVRILTDRPEITKECRELILQPQSEIYKVRQLMAKLRFLIISENMVKEDGKYYVMMKAVPEGFMKDACSYLLTEKEHYHYGRVLLERRHPVLREYLLWERSLCGTIMQDLAKEDTEKALCRRKEIHERLELIERALGYYNKQESEDV